MNRIVLDRQIVLKDVVKFFNDPSIGAGFLDNVSDSALVEFFKFIGEIEFDHFIIGNGMFTVDEELNVLTASGAVSSMDAKFLMLLIRDGIHSIGKYIKIGQDVLKKLNELGVAV